MTVDKAYLKAAPGRARRTFHYVKRAMQGRRNGVVTLFAAYVVRKGIRLSVRNTRPDAINVSRTLIIGPRGGLSLASRGRRRYLKARELGRGWK